MSYDIFMEKKKINLPDKHLPIKPLSKKEIHETARERVSLISKEFTEGFRFLEHYPKSVTFFGSARFEEENKYYKKARDIAGKIVRELKYSIVSGGGPGIMEASNRGARENDGDSVGLVIELPNEQVVNPYINRHIEFYYFFSRKVCLSFSAEAYIFFPGGFGTMDELFEILTLVQTHKIHPVPIILVGSDFWKKIENTIFKEMLEIKTIDEDDLKLYTITDNDDEIINIIKNAPIRNGESFTGPSALEENKEKLSSKKCKPCEGNENPYSQKESEEMLSNINQWNLIEDKYIEKTYLFKDFHDAMHFVKDIGDIADAENHHPDINLFGFNKVKVTLTTHAIKGLSENDFIMASKIDELLR